MSSRGTRGKVIRRGRSSTHPLYKTKLNRAPIEKFNEIGAVNTRIRTLIGGEDGALATTLHEIIIGRGGSTAMHRHDWEHHLVVESGRGVLETIEAKTALSTGDVVLVGAGEDHRFVQKGKDPMRFLVVTPL